MPRYNSVVGSMWLLFFFSLVSAQSALLRHASCLRTGCRQRVTCVCLHSPLSYSSSPQQPGPMAMPMVKPESMSHSPPTATPGHHRGPLQGDLRDMISMYIPGAAGDNPDPAVAHRGYSSVQQHYLSGTVPLTHIWDFLEARVSQMEPCTGLAGVSGQLWCRTEGQLKEMDVSCSTLCHCSQNLFSKLKFWASILFLCWETDMSTLMEFVVVASTVSCCSWEENVTFWHLKVQRTVSFLFYNSTLKWVWLV